MKTTVTIVSMILILATFHLACSVDEEQGLSTRAPALSAATQAAERIQRSLDPIAQQAQPVANAVQQAASDANSIGVPGAGIVALIATAIGALLGAYNERRRGTGPLKSAISQIVQSVDAAFPQMTQQQKSVLSTIQDRTTQRIVSDLKKA